MKNQKRKLFSEERENYILAELAKGAKSLEELSSSLGVSKATVRRDLLNLEERGIVKRLHGGAMRLDMLAGEPVFNEKRQIKEKEKALIAEKAAELIKDGDSIYLDGGSTVLAMCPLLSRYRNLSIVTNSLMAASELMESGHRLYIVGGRFRALSRTIVGAMTEKIINSMNFDKAFLGTIGVSEDGISTTDPDEAYTKELVMRRSQIVILLVDSSKFDRKAFALSGSLSDIDIVITDRCPPPQLEKILKKLKIKIIT